VHLVCYISEKYYVPDRSSLLLLYNSSLVATSELRATTGEQQQQNQLKLVDNTGAIIQPSLLATHYIWIEFVILAQALSFWFVKHCWWFVLKQSIFIDIRELLNAAKKFNTVDNYLTHRDRYILNYIVSSLKKIILVNKFGEGRRRRLLGGKAAICTMYFLAKLASLVNVFVQIFFINYVLELRFNFVSLLRLEQILNSTYFPYKSICAVRIKELTSVHVYAIMCNLPVNFFIQYILVFLLAWYIILVVFNIVYMGKYLYGNRTVRRYEYVRRLLSLNRNVEICGHKDVRRHERGGAAGALYVSSKGDGEDEPRICGLCSLKLTSFVCDFLSYDILFLIKKLALFSNHNREKLLTRIFESLWTFYCQKIEN
jgi:hypothetical protein